MRFYHDFSAIGVSVEQRDGIYPPNQAAKGPIITGYLLFALGKLKTANAVVSVAELFCADAYYAILAARFGASRCDAFDTNVSGHMDEAENAIKLAGVSEVMNLHNQDIFATEPDFRADIVMNTGGLYHVHEPLKALDISYQMANRYLIVQSVVSLANTAENYYEKYSYGCRFSQAYLSKAIFDRGWNVVDTDANELTGNPDPSDRGSAYYLISKH